MTFTLLLFLWTRKTVALTIVTGMVLYFSLSSWFMNRHWKTEESFWEQSIKYGARPLAHNNYGLAVTRKDPELSEYHFKKALEKSPYHIYTNINLGMLYLRQEKTAEGMKILRNVVRLNPNWALSHYWLSVGLKSVGQKQEYVSEAKRAADLDPRSFRYQYSAAKALQDAGRYQEAIPYFERIIKINPAYNMTEFWLGFALQKNGQSEEAIDMYSRFLRRKPDHVQGHFNLGYELMVVKKCTGAVEHFNKVLELRPSYKETHLYLSRCYKILRDEEMADRHIRKYREK
jgi:tetratricopeptide (TPR) repeat protein